MKELILTAALAAAATGASAGSVDDSFVRISSLPGIEVTDIPSEELGKATGFISEAKMIMLDSVTVSAADGIIAAIPQEHEWLTVTSDGTSVLMYGEETGSPDIYNTLLRVKGGGQDMVIMITGTAEMFNHIMN